MTSPAAGTPDRTPALWRLALWSVLALMFLTPLVAMAFTTEVDWGSEDFLFAAILLGALGIGIEAAMRFVRRPSKRILAILAVTALAALIWAEAAVGILPG